MAGSTERALRLLGLLQARPVWTGPQLAARLDVTTRSIRRDVDRLRTLGYPVRATQGLGGGYQLGAGLALPPLLLDDDEAVAVAVCLSLAAGGSVVGIGESALRTLAKLDQVMPPRLRAHVEALTSSTQTIDGYSTPVSSQTLLVIAGSIRARRRIVFHYAGLHGDPTDRRVEPYRMVATGRRWYLMAFDLQREDWRAFRLDRMREVASTTWQFKPREAPDAAQFIQRGSSRDAYPAVGVIDVAASIQQVRDYFSPLSATVEQLPRNRSRVSAGAESMDLVAWHFARLPWPYTIVGPPQLRTASRALAQRVHTATDPPQTKALHESVARPKKPRK
ncbi:MAG: WYL domain-containing protein [Antricoccus sp.]